LQFGDGVMITRACRPAIPEHGLTVITRYAASIRVHEAQIVFGLRVAVRRSQLEPPDSLGVITRYPVAASTEPAQIVLRARIALRRRLAIPRQRFREIHGHAQSALVRAAHLELRFGIAQHCGSPEPSGSTNGVARDAVAGLIHHGQQTSGACASSIGFALTARHKSAHPPRPLALRQPPPRPLAPAGPPFAVAMGGERHARSPLSSTAASTPASHPPSRSIARSWGQRRAP